MNISVDTRHFTLLACIVTVVYVGAYIPLAPEDVLLSEIFKRLFVVFLVFLIPSVLNGIRHIGVQATNRRQIIIKRLKFFAEVFSIFSLIGVAYVLHGTYIELDEYRISQIPVKIIQESRFKKIKSTDERCFTPCWEQSLRLIDFPKRFSSVHNIAATFNETYWICSYLLHQGCSDVRGEAPTIKLSTPRELLLDDVFPDTGSKKIKRSIKIIIYTLILLFAGAATLIKVVVALYEYIQERRKIVPKVLGNYGYSIRFCGPYVLFRSWLIKNCHCSNKSERERFKQLEASVTKWDRAVKLRAYADAVEAKAWLSGKLSPEQLDWLVWARAKADLLDPLLYAPEPN